MVCTADQTEEKLKDEQGFHVSVDLVSGHCQPSEPQGLAVVTSDDAWAQASFGVRAARPGGVEKPKKDRTRLSRARINRKAG
jgi:hypothetical protein